MTNEILTMMKGDKKQCHDTKHNIGDSAQKIRNKCRVSREGNGSMKNMQR